MEILLSIDSPHLGSVNPLERYLAMILGKGTHLASDWRKKKSRFYSPSLASFWQKKAVSCPTVSGIHRMNPELAWMVAIFWIGRKPGEQGVNGSGIQTVRTALEGLIRRFSLT